MKYASKKNTNRLYLLISVFFIVSVILPHVNIFSHISIDSFKNVVDSFQFKEALGNSFLVTIISTIISVVLAYILAYIINRTNVKHKKVLVLMFTLPMLIPSISHGLGLINIFGQNGLLGKVVDINIMGINGIVIGSVLYSFPVAFLMLNDAFKYIDNTMYDCARILGLNKFEQFTKITLYYLKKPLISCFLATFTMIFTDYGVPLVVGGRFITLPVFLYREVIGLLNFSSGSVIGVFLLMPALVSFIFDLFNKDNSSLNFTNNEYKINESKTRDRISTVFAYLVILILLIIFGSFVYLAFVTKYPFDKSFSLAHFDYIINNGLFKFLFNSLLMSALTALVGTTIAYFTAYMTSRVKAKGHKLLHILSVSALAIPGIVLGLAYVITFKNTFLYQSILLLVLVNIIHFFSTPYLLAYNALNKVNKNFEIIGLTCNVRRIKILKDVILPCTFDTIKEMFCYFFVNAMITISAISFLFTSNNMPLSMSIIRYDGQMMYEEAAIISLIILIINVFMKYSLNKICKRRKNNELQSI